MRKIFSVLTVAFIFFISIPSLAQIQKGEIMLGGMITIANEKVEYKLAEEDAKALMGMAGSAPPISGKK